MRQRLFNCANQVIWPSGQFWDTGRLAKIRWYFCAPATIAGKICFLRAQKKGQTQMSVPPLILLRGEFLFISLLFCFPTSFYAAPIALRCWKHSRQNTGRPCVGRKGTVVSFPHCEQFVFVSDRICAPPPPPSARFALQPLHRLGSFLKPLSAKNICSPAVKTNSAPHSEHFRTRSWYSMSRSPLRPSRGRGSADTEPLALFFRDTTLRERRARIPRALWLAAVT